MLVVRQLLSISAAVLWASAASAQTLRSQSHGTSIVAGWVESVTFPDYDIALDALLDTGADFSSLGVSRLDRFKRNGKIWYRFSLTGANGKIVTIEQESARVLRVQPAEVPDTRRPIVRLRVCVAGQIAETDFSLADRSGQDHAGLIGRRFLATAHILVDPSRMHLLPKACEARN